jgi:phosphatidate cytidylyltransferase
MLVRIVSALILIPVVLGIVFYAPPLFYLAALGFVGSLCLYEFLQIMAGAGWKGQAWFVYPAFWLSLAGFWWQLTPGAFWMAGVMLAAFLAAMSRRDPIRERVAGLMVNLLGVLYLSLSMYSCLAVRFSFGAQSGLEWTVLLLAVIWSGDTAALFSGKSFGRTPFARHLSPKKTNEGALGGLVAGVAVAVLLQRFVFVDLPLVHVMAAAVLIGVMGQLGDLAESMLKRAADVKDSSQLIPGHGGVLDRIDSLLFAFPVLCLYLELIRFGR